MIRNIVGSPATGGNFFGRESEQIQLWRALSTDNVLLLAPRRVGKTSLLRRLQATSEQYDARAVYMSVSHQRTELEFLRSLYSAVEKAKDGAGLLARAYAALRARLPALKELDKVSVAGIFTAEFGEQHQNHWRLVGEALVQTLRDLPGRWLLMIDEVPRFVLALLEDDRERARTFLNWFRDIRIDTELTSIKWVLCGSIGLDTVTRRGRIMDTINDLRIVRLGAYSQREAQALFEAVAHAEGLTLDPAARDAGLDRLGWLIPYHVQILVAALVTGGRSAVDSAAIDAAYAALLRPAHKSYFDYWAHRLTDELGKVDAESALAVLGLSAARDDGASRDDVTALLFSRGVEQRDQVMYLLDVLETDGYVVQIDGRYLFRSTLLRDYWRARFL